MGSLFNTYTILVDFLTDKHYLKFIIKDWIVNLTQLEKNKLYIIEYHIYKETHNRVKSNGLGSDLSKEHFS